MLAITNETSKVVKCNTCGSTLVYEKKDVNINEDNNCEYIKCPCCNSSVYVFKDKNLIPKDTMLLKVQTLNALSMAVYYSWSDKYSLDHVKKCFDNLNERLEKIYDIKKIFSGEETDINTLISLGFAKWSDEKDENGKVLYLIPLYLLPLIPIGTVVKDINGNTTEYNGSNIDNDTRAGLLAYGILVKEEFDKGFSQAVDMAKDLVNHSSKCDKNMKSIKEKLLEAGRYNSVLSILEKIIKDDQSSYPVDAYKDYSSTETKWRVDGDFVRNEASKLISKITLEEDKTINEKEYFYLEQYISTETCQMLHNYAVSISHRNDNPREDMEVIRTWEILENLLFNLDDVSSWTIPDGWKVEK